MRSGNIEANGQKLYYEIQGQGEPLLVISGLGGDIIGWGLQIEAWKEHFQVIAFDNRDAGRSSRARDRTGAGAGAPWQGPQARAGVHHGPDGPLCRFLCGPLEVDRQP